MGLKNKKVDNKETEEVKETITSDIEHENRQDQEIEDLKSKVADLQNKVLYSQAELINYRKRSEERQQELLKYKNEDLLLDLTDMIDNLDRAVSVKVESEESKKIQTGISMVGNQFKEILKKYGVVEIDALDKPFDSNCMDAMMIDCDDTKPDEVVLAVIRKGYIYKDRVLKHAVVKVNKIDNKEGNE